MKSIKSHVSLLLPLVAILFGLQFIFSFDRVVDFFEKKLAQEYTMVLAAKKKLDTQKLAGEIEAVDSMQRIDNEAIMQRFSASLPADLAKNLKEQLPFFYTVKLERFLNTEALDDVIKDLEQNSDIVKVESFKANHNQTYELLKLVEVAFELFVGVLTFVSFMLVYKQIVVWELEHSQRMHIMSLFGAPLMLRSGVLYKLGFINAVIAAFIVSAIFYYAGDSASVKAAAAVLGVDTGLLFNSSDFMYLIGFALVTVFLAVSLVIMNSKD